MNIGRWEYPSYIGETLAFVDIVVALTNWCSQGFLKEDFFIPSSHDMSLTWLLARFIALWIDVASGHGQEDLGQSLGILYVGVGWSYHQKNNSLA